MTMAIVVFVCEHGSPRAWWRRRSSIGWPAASANDLARTAPDPSVPPWSGAPRDGFDVAAFRPRAHRRRRRGSGARGGDRCRSRTSPVKAGPARRALTAPPVSTSYRKPGAISSPAVALLELRRQPGKAVTALCFRADARSPAHSRLHRRRGSRLPQADAAIPSAVGPSRPGGRLHIRRRACLSRLYVRGQDQRPTT